MKTRLLRCIEQADYNAVQSYLDEGWELNLLISDHPLHIDNGLVFPLVLYEKPEERPPTPVKPNECEGITSLKSVEIDKIDEFLAKGYTLLDKDHIYAKTATVWSIEPQSTVEIGYSEVAVQ